MLLEFFMPTKVFCCDGAVEKSAKEFLSLGKNCLIVTGGSSAKICGALDDVLTVFEKNSIKYDIYDKVRQNPSVKSCMEAGAKARDISADFILGIGGGSPLDAAKAAAVFAANPKLNEDGLYSLNWQNRPLTIAALGTTAGTGSEVTAVSVLTNSSGRKKSIKHFSLYPAFSLSDPKYMLTLPQGFTRSTAVDALAHCTESYFNKGANDMSRAAAVYGAGIIVKKLNKLLGGNELDIKDRASLYSASLLGGEAISVTGTAFPHAMGYFLSESYSVPHGTACAAFLPSFVEYSEKICPEYAKEFFSLINCEKDKFISTVKNTVPFPDVKLSEKEKAELLAGWQNNSGFKRCLGEFGEDEAERILTRLFS